MASGGAGAAAEGARRRPGGAGSSDGTRGRDDSRHMSPQQIRPHSADRALRRPPSLTTQRAATPQPHNITARPEWSLKDPPKASSPGSARPARRSRAASKRRSGARARTPPLAAVQPAMLAAVAQEDTSILPATESLSPDAANGGGTTGAEVTPPPSPLRGGGAIAPSFALLHVRPPTPPRSGTLSPLAPKCHDESGTPPPRTSRSIAPDHISNLAAERPPVAGTDSTLATTPALSSDRRSSREVVDVSSELMADAAARNAPLTPQEALLAPATPPTPLPLPQAPMLAPAILARSVPDNLLLGGVGGPPVAEETERHTIQDPALLAANRLTTCDPKVSAAVCSDMVTALGGHFARTVRLEEVMRWTPGDVARWAESSLALPCELGQTLLREEIHGPVLLSLTEQDLERLGVRPFGRRRQLQIGIEALRNAQATALMSRTPLGSLGVATSIATTAVAPSMPSSSGAIRVMTFQGSSGAAAAATSAFTGAPVVPLGSAIRSVTPPGISGAATTVNFATVESHSKALDTLPATTTTGGTTGEAPVHPAEDGPTPLGRDMQHCRSQASPRHLRSSCMPTPPALSKALTPQAPTHAAISVSTAAVTNGSLGVPSLLAAKSAQSIAQSSLVSPLDRGDKDEDWSSAPWSRADTVDQLGVGTAGVPMPMQRLPDGRLAPPTVVRLMSRATSQPRAASAACPATQLRSNSRWQHSTTDATSHVAASSGQMDSRQAHNWATPRPTLSMSSARIDVRPC